MTPSELGLLVLRVQADDVRPHEVRKFLLAMKNDPEVRRNAGLAGRLAEISAEQRPKYLEANALLLLTDPALAPSSTPDFHPHMITAAVTPTMGPALLGPWKAHFALKEGGKMYCPPTAAQVQEMRRGAKTSTAVRVGRGMTAGRSDHKYEVWMSSELFEILAALKAFWGVRAA
jgi:hypothetical protein